MTSTILSLMLSLHMMCAIGSEPVPAAPHVLVQQFQEPMHIRRLWWGLIDPELSAWFAQLPFTEADPEGPILWDWSWRGFWASLFDIQVTKEAPVHVSSV